MTDASAVSFSVLSVDTKESCKLALAVNPSDELRKEAKAEAIIARFSDSRRYYRIIEYSHLEELLAIDLVKVLDGDVGLAAKKLGIDFPALYRWVTIYEIDNGVRIRSIEATEEEKAYAVWLVEEYDGNVETVSKELRIDPQILRRWVNEYQEKKNAQIRDTQTRTISIHKFYTPKKKVHAISKVIENGGNMSVVAKELNMPVSTLRGWIVKHETENNVQIIDPRARRTYTDEEKAYAINRVKELRDNMSAVARELNMPVETLRCWVLCYEEETGEQIIDPRVVRTYAEDEKAYAINKVREVGGNMSVVAKELNMPILTLRGWIIKYEERTGEQIIDPRVVRTYTEDEKAYAINRVKELGGNVSEASRELGIPRMALYRWVVKYEKESGEQIRTTKVNKRYTYKIREHAISKVIENGGNISEVAKKLKIPVRTLQHWIIKYEERTGEQIRDTGVTKTYTEEEKAHAINRVRELGGNMSKVAKELNMPVSTLRDWIIKYEERTDEQIRKSYIDEEKVHAINRVKEVGGNVRAVARELDMPVPTLRDWVIKYEERTGEQIRDTGVTKTYTEEEKVHAINRVKEAGGNMSAVARELNMPVSTLHSWIIKYEERTGEQIRDTGVTKTYTEEEKAHAINRVKEAGGNVSAVAKELNMPKTTLRNWVIRTL